MLHFYFQTALAKKDAELEELKNDHSSIQAEQEDLLMMLSDQDSMIDRYKKRLKALGETLIGDGDNGTGGGQEEREKIQYCNGSPWC